MNTQTNISPASGVNQGLNEQLQWLLGELEEGILSVRLKKNRFKARASAIKILALSAGAILTLILGLQLPDVINSNHNTQLALRMIAFALGIVVTFLNALEPFFNYRALWIEHENALYQLYQLRRDVRYYVHGTPEDEMSKDVVDDFQSRCNLIWKNLSEKWISYRQIAGNK